MKQLKRVVFILEDGRMKYATHHDEITKWTDSELMLLKANFDKYGDACYTSDFKHYGVVYDELKALCRLVEKYNKRLSGRYDFYPARQIYRLPALLEGIAHDYKIDIIIDKAI